MATSAKAASASKSSSKPQFVWDDPFLFNEQLTEEERQIAEATQRSALAALAWFHHRMVHRHGTAARRPLQRRAPAA